ncbi:hypothetical protein KSP40_PGU005404 [Platanthera guangdongensis]|uniref:Uncharacterized protein n=1 Tax=Platanthera guangdongensis TaxID=2320717 RepID=A0ABR2LLN8_9ASPA
MKQTSDTKQACRNHRKQGMYLRTWRCKNPWALADWARELMRRCIRRRVSAREFLQPTHLLSRPPPHLGFSRFNPQEASGSRAAEKDLQALAISLATRTVKRSPFLDLACDKDLQALALFILVCDQDNDDPFPGLRLFKEAKDDNFYDKYWDDNPAIMAVVVVDAPSEAIFQTTVLLCALI